MSPSRAGQALSTPVASIVGSRNAAKKQAKEALPAAARGVVRPLPSALAGAALEQLLSVLARPDQRRCHKHQQPVTFSPPDYSAAQLQSIVALAARVASLATEDERAAEAVASCAVALPERPLQRLLAALETVGLPLLADFVRLGTYCDRIDCSGGSSMAGPKPGAAAERVDASAALASSLAAQRSLREAASAAEPAASSGNLQQRRRAAAYRAASRRAEEAEVPQVHRTRLVWTRSGKQAAREEQALGAALSGLSEHQVQQRALAAAGAVDPSRRRLSLPQVAILHALQGKDWRRQVQLVRLSQQHVDHGSEQQREMPHTEQELYAAMLADLKLPGAPVASGRQDRQEGQQQQEEQEQEGRQQDSATDKVAAASAGSKAPEPLEGSIFNFLMLH